MTGWDVATWLSIAVLGPGALVIFAAFVRDLLRPDAAREEPVEGDEIREQSGRGSPPRAP